MKIKNRIIVTTTIISLLITLVGFACPFILSYLVKDISAQYSDNRLIFYISVIVAVYTIGFFLELLLSLVTNRMSVSFKTQESRLLYSKMMDMSYQSLIEK